MTKQKMELKLAEKSADTVYMLLELVLAALLLSWAGMWGWNEGLVPALPQQRLERVTFLQAWGILSMVGALGRLWRGA